MSSVSERMRQRRLVSGAQGRAAMTLADLDRGRRATVLGYSDAVAPSTARRLFDLGLVPGVEVTMIRRAPLGDPVIFGVGGYEIALRRAQSDCITVESAG
jgi:ferrous iron transport protein A